MLAQTQCSPHLVLKGGVTEREISVWALEGFPSCQSMACLLGGLEGLGSLEDPFPLYDTWTRWVYENSYFSASVKLQVQAE